MKIGSTALRGRDFLSVSDLDAGELLELIETALEMKRSRRSERPLQDRHVAMLFQKPSHRTRVSFEVGIGRLGGRSTTLGEQDVQVGARESVEDAARVLDRYVDLVVARMRRHEDLVTLAAATRIPVINALTDQAHPCQALADAVTLRERFGTFRHLNVVYIGDGNNVANSLMEASALLGFDLTVVTPPGRAPAGDVVDAARRLGGPAWKLRLSTEPGDVAGAAVVYTDVWTSMGQEAEREARSREFGPYQVNRALMSSVPEALFMHCLPAHRGEEVTDEVIDGPSSIVFDQAENRLYAQMALMAMLVA